MRKINLSILALVLSANLSWAAGLDNLIQASKNMEEGQKALAEETRVFSVVKAGVLSGTVKPGLAENEIISLYGSPSTFMDQDDGGAKWIYKPGYGDYFSGTKIYLFFGADKKLTEARIVTQKKDNK